MLKLSLALYCDCLNGEVCTNTVYINIAMHFHTFYTMHVCDWWPQYWPQCLTRGSTCLWLVTKVSYQTQHTCLWLVTKVSYQGQHMSMTGDQGVLPGAAHVYDWWPRCLTRRSTHVYDWWPQCLTRGSTHVYDWWPQSYQGQHMSMTSDHSLTRGNTCLWLMTTVLPGAAHMSMTDDHSLTRGSTHVYDSLSGARVQHMAAHYGRQILRKNDAGQNVWQCRCPVQCLSHLNSHTPAKHSKIIMNILQLLHKPQKWTYRCTHTHTWGGKFSVNSFWKKIGSHNFKGCYHLATSIKYLTHFASNLQLTHTKYHMLLC